MSGDPSESAFVRVYRRNIGDPSNEDEVWGYWTFVVGVLLGVVGILLFVAGEPASGLRRWGTGLGASGVVLLVAGPVYRLPLRGRATQLVSLGGLLCLLAIAWFFVAFPGQWNPRRFTGTSGNIVLLYSAGLFVMAVAAVLVPIVSGGEADAEGAAQRESLDDETGTVTDSGEQVEYLVGDTDAEDPGADADAEHTDDVAAELAAREAELAAVRTSNARFELYEDAGGEHRWRLRHRNGNIVATSGEGYTRRHNAQKGLRSVKRNALGAAVVRAEDVESAQQDAGEPIESAPMQAPADPPEPGEESLEVAPDSNATFDLYEDQGGDHRWRLVHENGNVLADSGEGYTRRGDARRALERVREYAGPADLLDVDPAAFEVFQDRGGEWRWRLVHENGNVLGDGGEGYHSRWNARRAVEGFRAGVAGDADAAFEVYEDRGGEYRWRLVHANGNVVGDSGEGYADQTAAEDAVERVQNYAGEADMLDIGRAAFEVYEDGEGKWRWRLRHRNGNVLADSGQGYASRSGAEDGIDSVKRNAPGAEAAE